MFLLLLFFAGYILSSFIAVFVIVFTGGSIQDVLNGSMDVGAMKIIQSISSIGSFILPPVLLSLIDKQYKFGYLQGGRPASVWVPGLTIAIMLASLPFIEWTVQLNQSLRLPEALAGIERWIREKEEMMMVLTRKMLVMYSPADLAVNLLVVAVIPAIGEEFLFRGCLQNIFSRMTRSQHWGIWIAAILFSAIHLQFMGFLPRMLMGAMFGYLLLYSQNIWMPVLAHFVNNASAVVSAYVLQQEGRSLEELDSSGNDSMALVIFSLLFTLLLLGIFRKHRALTPVGNEDRLG